MAAVNRPTDTRQKEQDINQKLQLYGIYSAFSNGKVPSNKQIDVALNSALQSKALSSPSSRLSEEGRGLVADLKEVIRQAKYLLLTKNEGNLLQDFIWDAQNLEGGSATTPGAPVDKETAKQHGNEATEGLKTLGTLVLSNGQFRKLLNDATILIRDMAGDAAQNAANKVNPSEDKLAQLDEPADDNTWHDVPDLSAQNIKSQARAQYDKNKPFSKQEAQEALQEGADAAQAHPSADNQESGRVGADVAAQNLREKAEANVPEDTKETARNAKSAAIQNTKNYMGKKMPKERRDQTIWRLKKMITEIQGHPDYQEAIETLLSLAEQYGTHAKSVAVESKGIAKDTTKDNSGALTKLRVLIERFANSTSADDFFEALDNIYRDADQDPELKNWFKSVDKFIRKCLQEQGYVLRDESTEEYRALEDKGRFLLRERYRDHTDRILDETKFLADQFDKDPQNNAFAEAVQKLFNDLGKDEQGNAQFKPHLIKDLTEVIIPGIFENTRYVPIPRIEVSDPMIDAVVENLVIESDNLFPNVLEFGSDNYFRMGRRSNSSKRENKVMIAASGVQMDLRDVAYYIKKKSGFPSITDKGVMDIILAGEGFSFKVAARNAQKSDRTHFLAVDKVDVTVNSLSIKIKQSNHKLLFNIAKPLLLKVMKPVIQKVIEQQIKANLEKADSYAYGVQQEAQKAAASAKDDPENAPNMYRNYINVIQNRIGEKKEKAKQKASQTKVNVAVTKQDSMFKHISLPGGISTKATEYKELAAKGDRWESPVFGIGSAKESSDIPKLAPVTRKPHQTAQGGIRGGNHPSISGASGTTLGGQSYTGGTGGPTGTESFGTGNTGTGYAGAGNTGAGYAGAGNTAAAVMGNAPDSSYYDNKSGTTGTTAGFSNQGGVTGASTGFGNQGDTTSASTGFRNQVDQAFNPNALHSGLGNVNADTSGMTHDRVTQ